MDKPKVKRNIEVGNYTRTVKGKPQKVSGYNYKKDVIDKKELEQMAKKKISRSKAQKLFENRTEPSKALDLSINAKKMFEDPNELWASGINECDVMGIDNVPPSKKEMLKRGFEQKFPKKKAIWQGKETKAFKDWKALIED